MLFNSNSAKQAPEVCFSQIHDEEHVSSVVFSNYIVRSVSALRYLGLILDSELTFNERMKDAVNKGNRTITSFFVKPILEYADVSIIDKSRFKMV